MVYSLFSSFQQYFHTMYVCAQWNCKLSHSSRRLDIYKVKNTCRLRTSAEENEESDEKGMTSLRHCLSHSIYTQYEGKRERERDRQKIYIICFVRKACGRNTNKNWIERMNGAHRGGEGLSFSLSPSPLLSLSSKSIRFKEATIKN